MPTQPLCMPDSVVRASIFPGDVSVKGRFAAILGTCLLGRLLGPIVRHAARRYMHAPQVPRGKAEAKQKGWLVKPATAKDAIDDAIPKNRF